MVFYNEHVSCPPPSNPITAYPISFLPADNWCGLQYIHRHWLCNAGLATNPPSGGCSFRHCSQQTSYSRDLQPQSPGKRRVTSRDVEYGTASPSGKTDLARTVAIALLWKQTTCKNGWRTAAPDMREGSFYRPWCLLPLKQQLGPGSKAAWTLVTYA